MIIGINPGLQGAVAVLAPDGTLQALHDTLTLKLLTRRGVRQEYDVPGLLALLEPYRGSQSHVLIESSQALPGQGVRSMWTTGYGYGLWIGVLGKLRHDFIYSGAKLSRPYPVCRGSISNHAVERSNAAADAKLAKC